MKTWGVVYRGLAGLVIAFFVLDLVASETVSATRDFSQLAEGSAVGVPGPAFFVAPWGNDGNSGTEDQPFATLGRARDAMRADPDIDTTYVRGGTYYLSETLQLGAQDSGVTFAAYPGESVVLSGGELVTGFTAEGGGLYSVALAQPSGLDLTIAGEGLRVASSGVYDSANPYTSGWLFADAAGGGASKTTFRFAEGDITPDQISSSTLVQVYESARWGARTQSVEAPKEIQSIDFSSNSLTMEAAYKYALDTGSTYRLLNDADLISGLGEFAWRAEDGRLVVNPEDSSLLLSEGAVVARLDTLMQLDGADGVQIFGFTFSDVPYTGTALQVNDTDNALIAYNTFKNIGVGIELNGASHNTIFSNELMNLADEGIRLLGGSDFNQVAANYIHNIGVIYKHTAGIQLLDASDNTIAHNQIEDSARYGIALIEESNLRNIIEYNTVLRTSRETFDSGAINMWGKNVDGVDSQTIIRYNYIEDTGGLRTSSTKEWFANWGGKGIYLDDRASGVEIYGNFIKDANQALIQIHGGDQILIQNNVAILDGQKTLNHKGINNYDNFVYLQKQVNGGPGSELVDITIDGNIIYAVSPISDYWQYSNGGNPIVENNLLFNVPKWSAPSTGTPDAGSIIADPLFADPENGDYSLLTASPALSLGFTDLPYDQMGLDGADPLAALGSRSSLILR